MDDKNDIVNSVDRIRKRFRSETDEPDKIQMSFLDELNELVRKIFKDDPSDVYTVFTPEQLEKWKSRKLRRGVNRFFKKLATMRTAYFILLVTITCFLVSEAVGFYTIGEIATTKTYIKAILTEICFIFLSGYRAIGKTQTALVGVLRTSLFCLMLFVISSDVTMKGISTISEIDKIQEKIEFVETQIDQKDEAIEFYRKKDWGVNVRKQLDEKDKLVAELMELKNEQISGKNQDVSDQVMYQTWGRAAFRVILLLISVLITRRLFKF